MENNNDEVSLTDINTENPSNIVVTETSLTESIIMNGVANQSMPIPVKKDDSYEMFKMIQAMLEKQNDNINSRFDTNESNFNEIRDEIKQINKCFEKTNETIEIKFNELEQSIERMGVWRIDTGKCNKNKKCREVIDVNTGENYNGDIMMMK